MFVMNERINVLVTGGAGYIGSHACKALALAGFCPIAYDNLSRGNRWAVKWGPFEEGDIADANRLQSILVKYCLVALMHFAAFAYVGESVRQPLAYYENNVSNTVRLLATTTKCGPIPVVFSSSCATYGLQEYMPIPEEHPQHPINPNGQSKLFVERLLSDLRKAHGLRSVSLRYFNAAGADPDGEIGEAHEPETHLIPLAIAAACTGSALHVFGNDYETSDGTCVRDFVHVVDIANAHVQALKHLLNGGEGGAFNLANARGYSVKEVIAATERVCGRSLDVKYVERRVGDPPILIGDATRARTIFGFEPLRSELDTQITDAWNWIKRIRK
jgi:UDP-arabinose 4-epimerase